MSMDSPVIGHWYKDVQSGALFEVVAWDDNAATAEVQYIDGEIAEFDLETWAAMTLLPAVEPEDWRSSYELSAEDGVDPDLPIQPQDWSNPINRIEADGGWDQDQDDY